VLDRPGQYRAAAGISAHRDRDTSKITKRSPGTTSHTTLRADRRGDVILYLPRFSVMATKRRWSAASACSPADPRRDSEHREFLLDLRSGDRALRCIAASRPASSA